MISAVNAPITETAMTTPAVLRTLSITPSTRGNPQTHAVNPAATNHLFSSIGSRSVIALCVVEGVKESGGAARDPQPLSR